MIEHQVVIAGAGPTGMMLAGELALAGIDVGIVERRQGEQIEGTRARGLHSRSIEVLDQRGIAERFLSAGYTAQVAGFAGARLDISDFPTRHNYGLALVQAETERILADWIAELKVSVHRGCDVVGFTQDARGIDLQLANGETARAQYLVGCDGGRSVVRKAAGIAFEGWDASVSNLLAEVAFAQMPERWGFHHDAHGMHALSLLEDQKTVG
ncbi:MAG TPA: FAD-dependent monooxygenase, partial [Devosia sp.]|nr:FAD-dependent monooxygenase [Devosia sp.]